MTDLGPPANRAANSMPGVPTGDDLFFGRWWERRHTAVAIVVL
jgi:hypothetical protein